MLDNLGRDLPDAKIFFVDQWASVKEYDRVAVKVNRTQLIRPLAPA